MKYLVYVLCCLFCRACTADEVFASYGVGIFNSAVNSPTEVKLGDIGYRRDVWKGVYWQFKGGYWGDGSGDPNRSGSGFISTGPGLKIDFSPVELHTGWGLAAISSPDSYLGGRFPQFNGDLYLGVRDKNGAGVGLEYDHISSAGIISPNVGRDFMLVQISQKF